MKAETALNLTLSSDEFTGGATSFAYYIYVCKQYIYAKVMYYHDLVDCSA